MERTKVFFSGRLLTINEVIPILMHQIIEDDVPELPDFKPDMNPYVYVRNKLSKIRSKPISTTEIRTWCNSQGKSTTPPTLEDFLMVVQITRSSKPLLLVGSLINEKDPEEQANFYGSVFEELGDFVEVMGKNIKAMAPKYRKKIAEKAAKN